MPNQPFIFIKPHVARNDAVLALVDEMLARSGIEWISRHEITGPEIKRLGLVDRHYSVNAAAGTTREPAQLNPGEEGRKRFREYFGEEWDAAVARRRVKSGLAIEEELNGDPAETNRIWLGLPRHKIRGGMYAAFWPERDCYILNGFYPLLRAAYMRDDVVIRYGVAEFYPDRLTWHDFRHRVVGATDPARAEPDSIRGYLHAHAAEYGILVNVSNNVIHASASPFEAYMEKSLWLPDFDSSHSPLFQRLAGRGVTLERIKRLYDENPVITLPDGRSGVLMDLLEDLDTRPVAELLESIGG